MAQQVKDLTLSLLWLGLLMWLEFDPWPRNFCVPWVRKNKTKQKTLFPNKLTYTGSGVL